jgi:Ca2+-binding RTX toxin-like protein
MANIFGTNGSDLRIGTSFDDTIYGGPMGGNPALETGDDVLRGLGGNDVIFGYGGRDTLEGGTGRDVLYGGSENDILSGGDGNDGLVGGSGRDRLDGGDGIDIVNFGLELGTRGIRVNLSDTLIQDGLFPERAIDSFGSFDQLVSIENVAGTKFADRIFGSEVNNVLRGGPGNDTLCGGPGIDTLFGEAGNDVFLFNAPLAWANHDVIGDFNVSGDDRIALENSVMTKLGGAGDLTASRFFAGPAAHDASDHVIYNRLTGMIFYDDNADAPGGTTLLAVLINRPAALTAQDFVVV